MIPASYLFKDVFQNTWYEPEIEAAVERRGHDGHHARPWLSRLRSFFATRPAHRPAPESRPAFSQV